LHDSNRRAKSSVRFLRAARRASELNQDEAPLIQFEGGDFRREPTGSSDRSPSPTNAGELLAPKSSMTTMRIILLAVSIVCVVVVVSPRGRRVVARKFTDARPFVSRRAVDQESFASSRAVDTWESEGGAMPGASDGAR
jgi:hypothetical protein